LRPHRVVSGTWRKARRGGPRRRDRSRRKLRLPWPQAGHVDSPRYSSGRQVGAKQATPVQITSTGLLVSGALAGEAGTVVQPASAASRARTGPAEERPRQAPAATKAGPVGIPVAPGSVRLHVQRTLWLFLPRRARDSGELDLPHDPTATAGHLVQSAGIPLTEVGDLVAAGAPVSPLSRLRERDVLEVGVISRPQPLDGPARFLLDVHLGALARRLRLLGIDSAYSNEAGDDHLVEQAGREDRVLLSQDRGLLMRRALRRAAFVRGQDPDDQLADVIERFQPPLQPWSLCPACGGALAPVAKAQVADQLEPGTLRTQQQFSHCRSCGQVYWHGAHDARLQQLVRRYT